jgi:hypothetical protein
MKDFFTLEKMILMNLKIGESHFRRPLILSQTKKSVLKLFLLSLEIAFHIVLPLPEVIEWIKRISSYYQANLQTIIIRFF